MDGHTDTKAFYTIVYYHNHVYVYFGKDHHKKAVEKLLKLRDARLHTAKKEDEPD